MTRAARILLVANDGFSAGHVARTVAIARALIRREVRTLVLTTSEADPLLAGLAVVRLPAPATARAGGLGDAERRRLASAIVDGVIEGFAPDVVSADTFPAGPHGELAGIAGRAKRAVVRRATVDGDATRGDVDLVIAADDPTPMGLGAHVPPIVIGEPMLARDDARRELGLGSGRAILVASGGGGDGDACARADRIAAELRGVEVVVARGPLDRRPGGVRVAPLQRYLKAFDGAFAPAGYNTAHELAAARVPAALFAQPRPYDDQAARATRFAAAGFATVLDDVGAALRWMETATVPALACDGADRAADALIALAEAR